jgi:hypothetical protein
MIKLKNIPLYKQIYLTYLTEKQERALMNEDNFLYYKLTQKHFKCYFGLDLIDLVVYCPDLPESKAAIDRHICMCVGIYINKYTKGYNIDKNILCQILKEAFIYNLTILENKK